MKTLHSYFISKYGKRSPPEGWADDMKSVREKMESEEKLRRQTLTTRKIQKLISLDHFVNDTDVILGFFYEKDMKIIAQQHIDKCFVCQIAVTDDEQKEKYAKCG